MPNSEASPAAAAPSRPLTILVLGGTGFVGPAIVQAAIDRGHVPTLFNRGRADRSVFADLESLVGDRDPSVGPGLSALEGRSFDAVIDTAGYVPRLVAASADRLAPHTDHYLFISTVSVYADASASGVTEAGRLATIDDPDTEVVDARTYGALKVLCEHAVDRAMDAAGGRVTHIRPGFIVGPRERLAGRLPLWVQRAATRDRLACPGDPSGLVQQIDARDIGAFAIRCLEQQLTGPYNTAGPESPMTTEAFVDSVCAAVGRDPERVWVDEPTIAAAGLDRWFVPWIPGGGDLSGMRTMSAARALADGLVCRPAVDSARDTLAWIRSAPGAPVLAEVQSLIDSGAEDRLLAAAAAAAATAAK